MRTHHSPAHIRAAAALAVLAAILGATAASADDAESASDLGEALTEGKVSLYLRYRYEWVSDDAVAGNDAKASTLRTALGYRTKPLHGVSAFLELQNVKSIGPDDTYNNRGEGHLWNDVGDYPVVADPEITIVSQGYLDVAFADTDVKVGRLSITLDDERWVGPVGWRQNWQSFDAASVTNTSIPKTTLTYAFVANVNGVTGTRKDMASHLLHATVDLGTPGKLNAFGYLLDYDDEPDWGLSTATWGVRYDVAPKLSDDWKLLVDAAAAMQSDYGDNPASVDARYYHAELGFGWTWLTVKLGDELLSGSPGDGKLTTPLATLHKWNGWVDKFLTTPDTGLDDLYASIAGKHGDFTWIAIYHDFSADTGGADYGTELDLQLMWKAPWKQLFGLKLGRYDADAFSSDTDKAMLFTVYQY